MPGGPGIARLWIRIETEYDSLFYALSGTLYFLPNVSMAGDRNGNESFLFLPQQKGHIFQGSFFCKIFSPSAIDEEKRL